MTPFKNPASSIAEAANAATKILTLQTQLFLASQELKALRQVKRAIGVGIGLLLFNLMITLTFYWVEMELYERGWSPLILALISLLSFGILTAVCGFLTFRAGREP